MTTAHTQAGRTSDIDQPTSIAWWIKMFAATYGPYAFGTIALLCLWFLIMKPELNAARQAAAMNTAAIERVVDSVEKIQKGAVEIVHSADKIVARIERATERLEQR